MGHRKNRIDPVKLLPSLLCYPHLTHPQLMMCHRPINLEAILSAYSIHPSLTYLRFPKSGHWVEILRKEDREYSGYSSVPSEKGVLSWQSNGREWRFWEDKEFKFWYSISVTFFCLLFRGDLPCLLFRPFLWHSRVISLS